MGDHDLSLSVDFSPNDLRQRVEFPGFQTGYFQAQTHLGYQRPLFRTRNNRFALGWLNEAGFSYVGGNEGNLGSRLYQPQILTGLRAEFFNHAYLSVHVGTGVAFNYLNFGRGIPLDLEVTWNGQLRGELGVQHCFSQSFCPSVFVGYFVETTLAGPIHYINEGPFIGLRFSIDQAGQPPPPPRVEVRVEMRTVERRVEVPGPPIVVPGEEVRVPVEVPPPPELLALVAGFSFNNLATRVGTEREVGPGGIVRQSNAQLNEVARYLHDHPDIVVRIHGYANRTGTEARNNELSRRRAREVRDYLIRHGVAADHLIVDAASVHGSRDPIFPDPADEGNRRVRFEILSGGSHP